jgi:hypothetical protein
MAAMRKPAAISIDGFKFVIRQIAAKRLFLDSQQFALQPC